jgi:polyferredoxin
MLFDFLNRKFILFGILFGPHDFHLLVIAMISLIVFVVLFTAVFGRIFCGWACPQTIFMEMVFRKIEYWIEGDSKDHANLNLLRRRNKLFSSSLAIVFGMHFISNIFLSIRTDELIKIITDPPWNISGLLQSQFSGIFTLFQISETGL